MASRRKNRLHPSNWNDGPSIRRVTEKTEGYFFDAPIRVPSADFGGVVKKEVALADHVAALPCVDVVPNDLPARDSFLLSLAHTRAWSRVRASPTDCAGRAIRL